MAGVSYARLITVTTQLFMMMMMMMMMMNSLNMQICFPACFHGDLVLFLTLLVLSLLVVWTDWTHKGKTLNLLIDVQLFLCTETGLHAGQSCNSLRQSSI